MARAASVDYSRSWTKITGINQRHVTQSRNLIGQNEINLVTQQDEDGDTLLHIAVAKGNEMACRYLAALLLNANISLDIRNDIMQTPLHVSCIVDNPAITRLLLQANPASCDVTDRHGNNCVHLAVKHSTEAAQYDTLCAILEIATPHTLEKKNLYGYTPMHVAAIEGKSEAIRLLKKAGADINALDNRGGASPLILATRASQREAAQALLEVSSDVSVASASDDPRPQMLKKDLLQMCQLKNFENYAIILGANPTLKTTYGETASQLASARADHVISELLTLYDSSSDVTKGGNFSKYIINSTSSSKSNVKQMPIRHRDVKMKPFVNVTPGRHANIHPIASSIHHPMLFSSPLPQNQNVNVKSERQSPANSFPSNTNHHVAISNRRELIRQPLELTLRRRESRKSESPLSLPATLKRRSTGEDIPLDLTVKKAKASDPLTPGESSIKNPVDLKSDKHAFVKPVYHHAPLLLDRAEPRPHISTNHAVPGTSTAMRRSGSSGFGHQAVVKTPSASPRTNPDRRSEYYQYVQLPDGTTREILVDDINRSLVDSRNPARQVLLNRHSEQFVPKIPSVSPKSTSKNGHFYPVQVVDPSLLGLLNPMSIPSAYHVVSYPRVQQPIRKSSYEARDKFQPTTKRADIRDHNQPISERVVYARDQKEEKKLHPMLEQIHSLPTTFQSRPRAADETGPEILSTSSRERRYQSDGVCYDLNRFLDKQTASRRNSAPVQAKAQNEKLDLRSYTGCLPPHYLHLLESSGNLPIRPSNALRNVADVLRNNARANEVTSRHPDKRKSSELPVRDSSGMSNTPSSDPSTNHSSPATMSPPSKSNTPVNSLSKTDSSNSEKVEPNYLSKLGDWSNFESGDYPAFGKVPQLDKEKLKPPPFVPTMREYRVNESFVSEETKKLLKSVMTVANKISKVPHAPTILSTGQKHSCKGCLNVKKHIPPLIADMWRFLPFSNYVTSSGASSDVVYCWQIGSNKSSTLPTTSLTLNNDDVGKTLSDEPIRTVASIPRASVAPMIAKNRPSPSNVSPQTEQIRGVISQRSVTEKALKQNEDIEAIKNDNIRDDMLANVIEESDEEENDVISTKPLMNGHVIRSELTPNNVTNSNGFHESLTKVIHKTIMQNLERHSDVVRKLRSVQAMLSSEKKDLGNDAYRDYHLSDLEISDDEETETDKKSV